MMDFSAIIPYLKRYGVAKAAVFGSVARGEMKPGSDLDLVVSFSGKYDLLDMIGLKQDIEDILQVPVDLITYKSLRDDFFARSVMTEARVIYEQG